MNQSIFLANDGLWFGIYDPCVIKRIATVLVLSLFWGSEITFKEDMRKLHWLLLKMQLIANENNTGWCVRSLTNVHMGYQSCMIIIGDMVQDRISIFLGFFYSRRNKKWTHMKKAEMAFWGTNNAVVNNASCEQV